MTVRSYPGELAVLDGGVPEFTDDPAGSWLPVEGGAESEFVSKRSYPDVPHRIDHDRFDPLLGFAVLDKGDRSEDPRCIDENGGLAEFGFDGRLEASDVGRIRDIRREACGATRD